MTAEMPFSRILRFQSEISAAEDESEQLGLSPSPDLRKYWDNMLAIQAIEAAGVQHHDPIVDLGCRSGILLTWLHELGYRSLHGCDLRMPSPPLRAAARTRLWRTAGAGLSMYARNRTRMRRSPVEVTGFPSSRFAAAACMSVIEHGVDTAAFFRECARILRPGGLLIVSTDYWPEKINVGSLRRFAAAGADDCIFDRTELEALCRQAVHAGLQLDSDVDLSAHEALITSDGFRYTFALLAFRR